mmetsp:Transcript_63432/g.77625  ORF Transcript_63432/g.77625 Transcript_63432/m.77625 type:complete len:84 (+) Transcript_63432:68-319(+)
MENSQFAILVMLIAAVFVVNIIQVVYLYNGRLILQNQYRSILIMLGHLRSENIENRDEQKAKVRSRTDTPVNTPTSDDNKNTY